jgi:hypothetical protein
MTKKSNPWYRGRAYSPIFFVVFALLTWYGFQLLTRVVITCLPGGDACLLQRQGWPLTWLFWPAPSPQQYLYDRPALDFLVSLTTLALALWPAIQVFYPSSDPCPDKSHEMTGTAS